VDKREIMTSSDCPDRNKEYAGIKEVKEKKSWVPDRQKGKVGRDGIGADGTSNWANEEILYSENSPGARTAKIRQTP